MKFAIYPPVGIGRIGNSDQYNLSAEHAGSRGIELLADGSDVEASSWKDSDFRVKRQAVRFQVFEVPDDGAPPRPASFPAGTEIHWTAHLLNKKDAVLRPGAPPEVPVTIDLLPGSEDRVIDAGARTLSAGDAAPQVLSGRYKGVEVELGAMLVDASQRLILLGGKGISASPTNAPIGQDFYNNPGWYDDVSDGPIRASIEIPGNTTIDAAPAWAIFAPPDFAPAATAVVTLYDVILELAINNGWVDEIAVPSFQWHIRPLIERAASLRWVDSNPNWSKISLEWEKLGDPGQAAAPLRASTRVKIRAAESLLHSFKLQSWQHRALDAWAAGNFDTAYPTLDQSGELIRAALDGSVGQGFFPGIEAGVIVTDSEQYLLPFEFRIDSSRRRAGDFTALMAQPWQADFLKCAGGWWPSQRPDLPLQQGGGRLPWARPFLDMDDHGDLVKHAMQLGMVVLDADGNGGETGRDPAL